LQINELNFSQEIFTRDRLAEEANYNKETVRLNLLKDKLLRGLEIRTQERDELQKTKLRLTGVCVQESSRIDELETDNAQLLHIVEQNNQLIAHMQARPICPMNITGGCAISRSRPPSPCPAPTLQMTAPAPNTKNPTSNPNPNSANCASTAAESNAAPAG
jgi:hypothetical protein